MNKYPLLKLNAVSKSYPLGARYVPVLKDITLVVERSDLLAIVGSSGSGKSTLMNILGLLDKVYEGDYLLQGRNVAEMDEDELAELRNANIGFVFQQFNLLPRLTSFQNVALPLRYRDISAKELRQRVERSLAWVAMQAYADHCPSQLSGGQQQRIAIARALVGDPQVILADEPTGALDSQTGGEVLELFLALNKEGRTIILITHDDKIAAQCHRCIHLIDGKISHEK